MGFSLDNELDLSFNSSSLADDLEDFVKTDKVSEDSASEDLSKDSASKDFNKDSASKDFSEDSASKDFSEEDESDEINSLLDDKLDQIFNAEEITTDDSEQSVEDVDKHYQEDEVNLESVVDEATYAEIKYPCLLLNGASTNEEVDFLRSFSTEENDSKAIYLYCEAAQGVCEIGYVKLTLKFLLTLSRMPGYKLYSLYSDTSEKNEIKLDDPKVLSNFISL